MLPPSSPDDEEEFLHVPDPGEETADSICGYCMVKEGQEEHTEVEMKILKCASQANLTKDELIMVLKRVGGTKFKDFLDLRAEDFDGHGFLPLLKRRLCCFRSSLSRECWKLQEEDDIGCGSPPALLLAHRYLCLSHKPAQYKQGRLDYWFFHAVSDGCQGCVEMLVKGMGVDKNARSDTKHYTAYDFADHFNQHRMKVYLATL